MKNDLLRDRYGKKSSKRVSGLLLLLYVLTVATMDGFDFFKVNETLAVALLAAALTLLGIDSVTEIWKPPTNNTNTTHGKTQTKSEPE
jgi:hypothetical protein